MNKKMYILLVLVLFALPGCGNKKTDRSRSVKKNERVTVSQSTVNIPLAGSMVAINDDEDIMSLFEDEDGDTEKTTVQNQASAPKVTQDDGKDFNWVEEKENATFKTVYFDFDKSNIRNDQKESVSYNAEQLKETLAQARQKGEEPKIVIEGHACHSAGDPKYNFTKAFNRAQEVSSILADLGVSKENIKVVSRGQDIPVVINGKKVTGSRTEQWPNRRVEVHIIYS